DGCWRWPVSRRLLSLPPRRIEGKVAVLAVLEILPLELEVRLRRVEIRCPFQDAAQRPQLTRSREGVRDRNAGGVDIVVGPVLWGCREIRKARLPRGAGSEISAERREEIARAEAVLVAPAFGPRRKAPPATDLDADIEVKLRRRHPLQLDTVVRELVAQEHLVRERHVGEVPGVRMHLVLVADAGEEPSRLDGES